MKKQFDSHAAAATAQGLDPGRLFSEIGLSATFFDSMPAEIVIVSETGEILAANDRFRREFGDTPGLPWNTLLINEPVEVEKDLKLALSRGMHSFKVLYETSKENLLEFNIEAFKLSGNTGRLALIHRPVRTRTGFWNPEEESFLSDESGLRSKFYRRYVNSKLALISLDSEYKICFANRVAGDLLNTSPLQLTGQNIRQLLLENDMFPDKNESVLENGEKPIKMADGKQVWLDFQELPGFGNERLLILRDVSARKSEESQLHSTVELYRTFLDQSDQEIFRFDITDPLPAGLGVDPTVELILNSACLSDFGSNRDRTRAFTNSRKSEERTFGDFFGSRAVSREVAEQFVRNDYKLYKKEIVEAAEKRESFFTVNLIGVLEEGRLNRIWMSRRDTTKTKQAEKAYLLAEDQLRQSQKIEPIGRLAGGIAHDFNNFLAVIMLQIEMMNQELEETNPLRRRVGEIKTVTDKAANMVKQLLAFGRKQTMQPRHLILNGVVEEFIKMTGSLIGEDIEIELSLREDLGVCYVDPNQIMQILMNLAINSKDALPGGGKLRISTSNLSIDEDTFKHRAQPKGNYIQLSVEDTGIGMAPETIKHVFEPFFTTKETQKGTGLGLSTVYGIVKQSKGFIWVDSKVGEGTRFRVQFPRTDSPASDIKPECVSSIPRGTETILLVEDEDLIRKTSVEVLTSLGYTILEARDGEDAAMIASGFEGDIDLLLTDVVMPRMNGRELAKAVKASHPETAVLFMSGYADDIITRHGILEEDVQFIGKPFSPLTLAVRVREALGER